MKRPKTQDVKILGACNTRVAGATLFIGSEAVVSVNEERFTRIKNQRIFPRQSIEYCLGYAGLKPENIDYVSCGAWGGVDVNEFLPQVIEEVMEFTLNNKKAIKMINDRVRVALVRDGQFKEEMISNLKLMGFDESKMKFYDHHLSHAYTAFYCSPFDEALILTMDGRGDFKSATVSTAKRKGGLRLLDSVSMFNSLGAFYGFLTRFLGFTPDKHEGKVTGLAAYGDKDACLGLIRQMIAFKDNKITANPGDYYTPFLTGQLPEFEQQLSKHKKEDIAAAAQYLLEEIVTSYLKIFLASTRLRKVCLAGGVFANVKLNQKIMEMEGVEDIYVFPEMGDGGNAFGGGLISLYECGGELRYPLKHAYLGPDFSCQDIENTLKGYENKIIWLKREKYNLGKIAKDIADGKIIGFFNGRMEYGPRALGSRSILCRAVDRDITKVLNKKLNRTEFMPFAPVTLDKYAQEYYLGWKKEHLASQFMTVCYNCSEKTKKQSPGIVHVDGTARPQVIFRENNPLYYDLLTEYYKITGIPTLINTSFNNHEEPIVCNPKDAVESLLLNNVDYILMEPYVVFKRRKPPVCAIRSDFK